MNTEEQYDLIERYLDKQMTEEETIAFEQLLEKDADLKEQLELHQQMAATLKGEKIHQLRAVLAETDRNWQSGDKSEEVKIRPINFRRIIAIAATVLILVLAYQFIFSGGGSVPSEQLFADHFQPYQMLLSQRDITEDEKNVLLEKAISAYAKQDFQNASDAFEQLSQSEPENSSYLFYQAIAQLGAQKNVEAIARFEIIMANENHPFKEQARWYMALAYLKKGNADKTKDLLTTIQLGQFKYKEAQEVLKGLK